MRNEFNANRWLRASVAAQVPTYFEHADSLGRDTRRAAIAWNADRARWRLQDDALYMSKRETWCARIRGALLAGALI